MKQISLIISLALTVMVVGCSQSASKQADAKTETIQQTEVVEKAVENTTYQTVESLFEQAESLAEKTVNVQGTIEHVCKHGGKRFKILSTDGSRELKIELGENFDALDANIVGSTAMVTGLLKPTNMDAEMVKAWEKKMKKNHAGEENTNHYKEELAEIQAIHKQIVSGEIPYYIMYTVHAEKYDLQN